MDEQEEALRARAQARLGSTLRDKYRLDRVLGIGGMATVFAATHRNQAELAVKLLHPELSLRDDLKKRFLREGYVGNSVKHPGAVLVVDDDIAEDGSAFLVMELLRGRSLEDVWDRAGRCLPTRVVVAFALQLLEVLAAAHEKAIIHRDLKPANLFLTVDGSLKVLDFGIARLRDAVGGGEHATRTGTLMGTPAFMAPEQAQAVAAEIDGQTDLWAVGATMYTLLSGQLVHDGENSSQLLIRAGTSRARPLNTVAPAVEAGIAEVVDRALAFEKPSRWASANAMRDALLAAAVAAFGKAPGRDELTPLVEGEAGARRLDSVVPPGSLGKGGSSSPRLVFEGQTGVRANDPTFATPGDVGAPTSRESVRSRPRSPISGVSPPLPLPGVSTGYPVSAEAPTARKAPASVPVANVVTGFAVLLAIAALSYAGLRSRTDGPPTTATSPTSALVHSAGSAGPSAVPSGTAGAAVDLPPVAPTASASASSAAPVASTVLAPSNPAASASSPPAKLTRTPPGGAATPKPHPSAAPDCTTTYTLDENGDQKWKPECVR